MRFYNRVRELEFFHRRYISNNFEFILLHGRRRIGKTYLLRKFVQDKKYAFFVANQQGSALQLPRLYNEISKKLTGYKLNFSDIEEFFQFLTDLMGEKIVVVLDEFQYLVEIIPDLPSIIKTWIEDYWIDKNFMLIICGSSIGMMLDLVDISQPLYGMITGKLQIKPFNFLDLLSMFPELDIETVLKIYGVYGGSPAYLVYYDTSKPFLENLFETIFSYGHKLFDEPSNLVQSELPSNTTYMDILYAISVGKNKNSEIAGLIKKDVRNIPLFLSKLENLDLITKSIPAGEKQRTKIKKYFISDFFFKFWFKFKYPNETAIEEEDFDYLKTILDDQFDQYMGHVLEIVVQQLIKKLNTISLLPFKADPKRIGNWWNTSAKPVEMDIIALDRFTATKKAIFIETKWGKNIDFKKELKKLISKVERSKFEKITKTWYAIVARGFSSKEKGAIHIQELIRAVVNNEIIDFYEYVF